MDDLLIYNDCMSNLNIILDSIAILSGIISVFSLWISFIAIADKWAINVMKAITNDRSNEAEQWIYANLNNLFEKITKKSIISKLIFVIRIKKIFKIDNALMTVRYCDTESQDEFKKYFKNQFITNNITPKPITRVLSFVNDKEIAVSLSLILGNKFENKVHRKILSLKISDKIISETDQFISMDNVFDNNLFPKFSDDRSLASSYIMKKLRKEWLQNIKFAENILFNIETPEEAIWDNNRIKSSMYSIKEVKSFLLKNKRFLLRVSRWLNHNYSKDLSKSQKSKHHLKDIGNL